MLIRDIIKNKWLTNAEISQIRTQISNGRTNENNKNADDIDSGCAEPSVQSVHSEERS